MHIVAMLIMVFVFIITLLAFLYRFGNGPYIVLVCFFFCLLIVSLAHYIIFLLCSFIYVFFFFVNKQSKAGKKWT